MKNFQTAPASDIESIFGKKTYIRGKHYFLHNRVIDLGVTAETANTVMLNSCVVGSGNQRYNQVIAVNKTGRFLQINGRCSCPVGYNCKHVAAACLAHRQTKPQQRNSADKAYINWLTSLDENLEEPDASQEFIVCVLRKHDANAEFSLSLLTTREKKQGGLSVGRQFTHANIRYGYFSSRQYTLEEQELFRLVASLDSNYQDNALITGALGHLVLSKALQNGRLFWNSHQHAPPMRSGGPRPLQLSWHAHKDNTYILDITVANRAVLLPTEPPLYLDEENLTMGTVDCANLTYRQYRKMLSAPPVPVEHAEDFTLRLLTEHPELPVPPPRPVELIELSGLSPRPRLNLLGQQLDNKQYIHLLKLRFDYGDHTISAFHDRLVSVVKTNRGFFRISRDQALENAAVQTLLEFGFRRFELHTEQDLFFYSPAENAVMDSAARWSHFIDHQLPLLTEQGWLIETDDSFRLQFQQPQNWDAEIEQSGNDWFRMHFNITLGNQSLPLLPLITPVLESYDRDHLPELLSIPIGEHQYVNIAAEQLRPFLDILYELYDSAHFDGDGARISRYNAAMLADMERQSYGLFSLTGGRELIETGKKLRNFKGIANVSPPATLRTRLREYQQKGLNWLQFLREYRFGGILADDMGLGKTVQTLAHLLLEKESGRMDKPCLIVAPTSLMSNWRREAERFTPDLTVLILQGSDRKQHFDKILQFDLVLTTYPLLYRDEQHLLANAYYYLILDEAQVIKNPKARAAHVARRIDAQHRLCLTGTPMENHLGELWAQYDFLMPDFLGDQARFKKTYRTPIEMHGDIETKERLSRRLEPFMLRRTKHDVADELPEKTEIIRSVPLLEKQAALYESIRVSMEKRVRDAIAEKGLARSHITILDALLKLRQTCCDPRTLRLKEAQKFKHSAKLDLLMEMLPELLEEGRRILVFSQFTRMLGLIETELNRREIGYSKLTGQTRRRDEAIELFKSGQADVFLISLKAGGVGLNLTEADTVIIYDPWWNPAVESQAADRAHRIGQNKAVFVYKLITENTVEEKILEMQKRKRALSESVYRGGKKEEALQLSAKDLTELFKPLAD
ncbi:SWIM zinc finger [Nitrosomonas sp. Nm51]|uniref:DEAD/DEAH box helicase n=1 Tax=Nitrosomonas sp. Nm51 TaxID=133720 RepID=UPI0008CD1F6C|nr:SNF2-related protein [Nitrosomonas sp. Nm51]SEQ86352.1 SWIM zinc finger [Nitrosomonas sp. Nm51]